MSIMVEGKSPRVFADADFEVQNGTLIVFATVGGNKLAAYPTGEWSGAFFEGNVPNQDQPVCETDEYGNKCWYLNGLLHRLDGPAAEWSDGTKSWYINGQRHRLDGPAIEHANGSKEWRLNGQLHRLDGPAIEWADGSKEWWLDGKRYADQESWEAAKVAARI